MDPTVVTALITLGGAGLGWLGKAIRDGIRESRQGRKDEAQRIATDRDRLRTERDAHRARAHRWADLFWATRSVAMQNGVPPSVLPHPPDDL